MEFILIDHKTHWDDNAEKFYWYVLNGTGTTGTKICKSFSQVKD